MKFIGYKRATDEAEAKDARARFKEKAKGMNSEMTLFRFDHLMGQRGLLQTLRMTMQGDVDGIIVDDLKDLGRDLISLVKALDGLMTMKRTVIVLNGNLHIKWLLTAPFAKGGQELTQEGQMTKCLMAAHHAYVSQNRKIGIASAKAAGAQVGRPAGLMLDDVQEIIEKLMNANKGKVPSVRKLAKESNCSIGVAQKLLKQYRTEQNEHAKAQRPDDHTQP